MIRVILSRRLGKALSTTQRGRPFWQNGSDIFAFASLTATIVAGAILYRVHNPISEDDHRDVDKKSNDLLNTILRQGEVVSEFFKFYPKEADFIIIGSGPAGIAASKGIREADTQSSILVIGNERSNEATSRHLLSKLRGFGELLKTNQSTSGDPLEFIGPSAREYEGKVVKVQENNDSTVIVTLEHGHNILARKGVIIATGVYPDLTQLPPIPDKIRSRCITLRKLEDFTVFKEKLKDPGTIAFYGSGYLASELSASIKSIYPNCTVDIFNPSEGGILSTVFPEYLSRYIEKQLRNMGVKFSKFKAIKFSSGPKGVRLISDSGKEIDCNILILDPPSVPAPILVINKDGNVIDISDGIPCNEALQCTPNIYTAGDTAKIGKGARIEHYNHATHTGHLAGQNLALSCLKGASNTSLKAQQFSLNSSVFHGDIAGIELFGIGRVDNRLSTIGLWETMNQQDSLKEYRRGAILYYEEESNDYNRAIDSRLRRIRGVLLVNLPEKHVNIAKNLINQSVPSELSEVSNKLFS